MNLNLYGYGSPGAHRWLMIDCGVSFGGDGIPGADVMMADPSFIVERRDQFEGLVLTHAHEDHLGAVRTFGRGFGAPFTRPRSPSRSSGESSIARC